MRRLPIASLLASALSVPLVAQAPPAFDVASIRPNTVEPLPDMAAASAPARRSASFI